MTSNRLNLNAEKTQFIRLGSSYYTASVSRLPLSVGGSTVFPDDTVRNLGMTFDAQLATRNHVDNVVRSCFIQLHQLRPVRRSLTHKALNTLVHAFITSRIDYCNALLYSVADGVIRRLQSVLHAAARLITGIRRYEHVIPTLRDTLHWLPISQRITFKIALMMFDCRTTLVMCALLYTPLLYVRDYDLRTSETSSSHACGRLVLAAAASACVVRQSRTNCHRICEAQTLEKSLSAEALLFECAYGRRRL